MTAPLQPMSLGGILDRAIQLLRARFPLFIGIALLPGLVELASQLAAVYPKMYAASFDTHIALVLAGYLAEIVFAVANMVLQAIATAAICFATSRINFGEEVTIHNAFGAFIPKVGRLVWLSILQALYAFWPFIIALVTSTFFGLRGSPLMLIRMGTISVLSLIPCIALYVRYALAFPACAIENLSAHDAIKRSISLSKGNRWKICWGFLLPCVLSIGLNFGFVGLIRLLKVLSSLIAGSRMALAGLEGTGSLLVSLVFIPLSAIVLTLLYYDQRIRREGFDVEMMMDAAGLIAPATLPSEGNPATPKEKEEIQA